MFKSDERQETPQRPQDGVSDPIGFNLIEAVLHTWNVNVFALVPIDDTESRLNSVYEVGPWIPTVSILVTRGLPSIKGSIKTNLPKPIDNPYRVLAE